MREFILYVDTAEWGIYANGYELWGKNTTKNTCLPLFA